MKKLLIFLVALFGFGSAFGQSTSPNLGLSLPAPGSANWNVPLNANSTIIDNLFGGGSCQGSSALQYDAVAKLFGCANLSNASTLLGGTWAIPGTIGSTTPNTGQFTNVLDTGLTASLPVCTDGSKNLSTTSCLASPPAIGTTTPAAGHFSTLDATGGITAIADGVHAGIDAVIGNTTVPTIPSNSFGFIGPNSASFTSYFLQLPSTAPAANTVMLVSVPTSNVSSVTFVPALAIPTPAPGTTITLAAPAGNAICTSTCTVTIPVPAAGYKFCILNDDNVATVITLAALGSSARYENTARTAYGTAGTGTLVSNGAAANRVCIEGRDATHYLTTEFTGTWTAN